MYMLELQQAWLGHKWVQKAKAGLSWPKLVFKLTKIGQKLVQLRFIRAQLELKSTILALNVAISGLR